MIKILFILVQMKYCVIFFDFPTKANYIIYEKQGNNTFAASKPERMIYIDEEGLNVLWPCE